MLHLGIGRAHARTEIICLIHNNDATITTHDGTVLAEYVLDPTRDYQQKRLNPRFRGFSRSRCPETSQRRG